MALHVFVFLTMCIGAMSVGLPGRQSLLVRKKQNATVQKANASSQQMSFAVNPSLPVHHAATISRVTPCAPGDQVQAINAGIGRYMAATVVQVNALDNTVTVDWPDSSPFYRVLEAGAVMKGSVSCQNAMPPIPMVTGNSTQMVVQRHGSIQESVVAANGVVHFLFLVNDQIVHKELWVKYLEKAPPNSYTVRVHCKDAMACRLSGVLDIPGMKLVPTTPTWYCHDLVTAMAQLLKHVLDPHQAFGTTGGQEKFVFVSDSTLPVKPFQELHASLVADNDSDFCVFPKSQWGSAKIDGHDVLLVKHHQWLILNKVHAQMFVDAWVPVDARGVWHVWLRDQSWKGKERYLSPQHFHHPPGTNWCTDEWAFVATLFGAVQPLDGVRTLPQFGGGSLHTLGPAAETTQGRCRTFTYWSDADGPSFANIGRAIHSDWGSYMSCYPRCYQRPATFGKLSTQGLQALRHSEFLFARKFTDSSWLPDYEAIVIR